MEKIEQKRVGFDVDGTEVVGFLYGPQNQEPVAGVVCTGPLTSVKEQVTDHYARALAKRGFAALSFDHRYFGESGGEPRQYESPPQKVRDIREAVRFLGEEAGIARIGAVGICAGAGYMAGAVADIGGIGAWGAVAGFFHDNEQQRQWMGDEYEEAIERAQKARRKFEAGNEVETIPAVGDGEVAMPLEEAFEYYGTDRGGVDNWTNAFAVMSREHTLPWDAQSVSDKINIPTLVIHSDNALAPALARKFFENLKAEQKELVWVESRGQIDFYDDPALIGPACDRLAAHFQRHL